MAKKKASVVVKKPEPEPIEMPIQKYFQLHSSEIHPYTRAYLEAQFRGIMNTKEAWRKLVEANK